MKDEHVSKEASLKSLKFEGDEVRTAAPNSLKMMCIQLQLCFLVGSLVTNNVAVTEETLGAEGVGEEDGRCCGFRI